MVYKEGRKVYMIWGRGGGIPLRLSVQFLAPSERRLGVGLGAPTLRFLAVCQQRVVSACKSK